MFNRTKCPRCNNKFSKKYNFCPHCGLNMKEGIKLFEPTLNMPFPFNTIFKQLEKQIEKELKSIDKGMINMDNPQPLMQGLTISVDMNNGTPVIRMGSNDKKKAENAKKIDEQGNKFKSMMSEEKANEMSKLPKEEPSTTIRRMADRIMYEINLPGVQKENVIVTRMHNSIEIKAYSKDKAYFKLIPISLPILNSELSDGKLVLEFKPMH